MTRAALSFCDTTVLVAALDAGHSQHRPCIGLLASLTTATARCALHSFAEVYAVMSGRPSHPRLRPQDVEAMVTRLDRVFTPIALTRSEYLQVIRNAATSAVHGGRIYDALIGACALKCKAKLIYTLNTRDFFSVLPPESHVLVRAP